MTFENSHEGGYVSRQREEHCIDLQGGEHTWCVQGAEERVGRTTEPDRAERGQAGLGTLELVQSEMGGAFRVAHTLSDDRPWSALFLLCTQPLVSTHSSKYGWGGGLGVGGG